MASNHHETLHERPVELPSERSTGLVFAAVFVIAAAIFRSNVPLALGLLAGGAGFAAIALFRPMVLGPLNRLWFRFALLLNKIVAPVIMFVLFAVVIVPAGLLMQLFRDPLQAARRDERDSYWIARKANASTSTMHDQF